MQSRADITERAKCRLMESAASSNQLELCEWLLAGRGQWNEKSIRPLLQASNGSIVHKTSPEWSRILGLALKLTHWEQTHPPFWASVRSGNVDAVVAHIEREKK